MAKKNDDFSFEFSTHPAVQTQERPDPDTPPADDVPETELELEAGTEREHKPFRILILGDFSGRTNRGICAPADLAARKIRSVDIDNFAQVMTASKVEIRLPVGENAAISLSFCSLDDFRPDAIVQKVPAFSGLLALKQQLLDTNSYQKAAEIVRKLMPGGSEKGGQNVTETGAKTPQTEANSGAKPGTKGAENDPKVTQNVSNESEFERLLGGDLNRKNGGVDDMIANLVAGYGVPDADPQQSTLVALVEDALAAGLRAVLRHPAFQAVEGAWRSAAFLTSRMDTDGDLKICLLDVSKEELAADLARADVEASALYQILVERMRVPGAVPFALVVGDYEFDQTEESVRLLARVAALMKEARVPFVAGASAKVMGWESFAKVAEGRNWEMPADLGLWQKFRESGLASYVVLAAPRFLLRMPYGPKTDAIEAFGFQEIAEESVSGRVPLEQFLWGNGAFAVALLYGQAFLDGGWDGMDLGNDVSDLPCYMALVDGDREMVPCAQAYLSDRVADFLRQAGLVPVLSVKNEAAVKVAGVWSMAKGPLNAWWAR